MELQGTVAVVTGASSGIGRATALAFARRGSLVVAAARRQDRLDDLVAFIRGRGGAAEAQHCDVTRASEIAELARGVLDRHGRCDVLVNNAGIRAGVPFLDLSKDEVQALIDTNLMAVIWGTRAFLPTMLAAGSGHIVNVSSLAGRHAVPGAALYSATKHAVAAFSESMHHETAPRGVLVTSVNPGFVDTEGFPQGDLPDAIVMEATTVARAIARAVERGRAPQISVPRSAGVLEFGRVLMPGPYRWLVGRAVRRHSTGRLSP